MAKRLATEYVKTCLRLSESELNSLIELMAKRQVIEKVKVLENGNQEIVFHDDDTGSQIVFSFERIHGKYMTCSTCKVVNRNLTDALRQAVARFKGDAVVHRVYEGFTMIYTYENGAVVKIDEWQNGILKNVYQQRNTLDSLEQTFCINYVEEEIRRIRLQIDEMLDWRLTSGDQSIREHIDRQLTKLTHRLFVLEA
jgi:hypothetical protein